MLFSFFSADPPVIKKSQNIVIAAPGSPAKIDCVVESTIPYNVSWKKLLMAVIAKVGL